jgi:hypothetical protein
MYIYHLRKIFHFLVLFLIGTISFGQVGVGNVGIGTTAPDLSAALDIVSSDKGILIPRVTLTGLTDITTITHGNKISMLVYNTAFVNDVVPGFYYWNGQKWAKIAEGNGSIYSGTGTPTFTYPKNPTEGDFYIELPSGNLHHFDGEGWRTLSGVSNDPENLLSMGSDGKYFLNPSFIKALMSAENGLTKNVDNKIELGGNLVKATSIQTTPSNTLAIKGLENGNINQNEFVTIDPVSGVLSKTNVSSLLTVNESVQTGVEGQTIFLTPSQISDIKKVHVYRNGVRINSTYINSNTIKLEDGVSCVEGDEIRIVQYN